MNHSPNQRQRQTPPDTQIVYLLGTDAVPPLHRTQVVSIAPSVGDWVIRPALIFWVMGAGAGGSAALLLGESLALSIAWALVVGGGAGLLIGGSLAILRPTERSRTVTQYQAVTVQASDGRYIPISEAGGQRQLRIEQASLIVGDVTFRPAQLDAMREAAADNGRLTRNTGGWSGPEYQRVTAALAGAGYVQRVGLRAWEWTDAGLRWLSPTPQDTDQDATLTGDQDDDDQDDQ